MAESLPRMTNLRVFTKLLRRINQYSVSVPVIPVACQQATDPPYEYSAPMARSILNELVFLSTVYIWFVDFEYSGNQVYITCFTSHMTMICCSCQNPFTYFRFKIYMQYLIPIFMRTILLYVPRKQLFFKCGIGFKTWPCLFWNILCLAFFKYSSLDLFIVWHGCGRTHKQLDCCKFCFK